MRDYYREFIQKKQSESMTVGVVPKVSKDRITTKKTTFGTFGTSLHKNNPKNFVVDISVFIKNLQSSGVDFYIGSEYFEIGGRNLSNAERKTVKDNSAAIHCYLQQLSLNHFIFKNLQNLNNNLYMKFWNEKQL